MATTEPQIQVEETTKSQDPFANQRETVNPLNTNGNTTATDAQANKLSTSPKEDRRLSSDEWDASKTPPSRFQQRKGSVYATPGSRDGRVDKNYERDAAYHAKLAEKGWGGVKRRSSKGEN